MTEKDEHKTFLKYCNKHALALWTNSPKIERQFLLILNVLEVCGYKGKAKIVLEVITNRNEEIECIAYLTKEEVHSILRGKIGTSENFQKVLRYKIVHYRYTHDGRLRPQLERGLKRVHDFFELTSISDVDAFLTIPEKIDRSVEKAKQYENIVEEIKQTQELTNEKSVDEFLKSGPLVWNSDQDQALRNVFNWLKQKPHKRKKFFFLAGFAGTGKTTLAKFIAEAVLNGINGIRSGHVLFAAFTGKAALRLKQKGCLNASTIHSLIYRPVIDNKTGQVIGFTLNQESPLRTATLLIVDEVSMVNEEQGQDLLSFKVPILCLGDPGQLPPVQGEGFFIKDNPDYMLTTVTRQAKDNPIIHLATLARKGEIIKPGRYGDSLILKPGKELSDNRLIQTDQVLCGTNNTRKSLNQRYRKLLEHSKQDPFYPIEGERLICLKNNRTNGLLNGTQWQLATPPIFKPIRVIANYRDYITNRAAPEWKETKWKGLHVKLSSLDGIEDADQQILILSDIQISCHLFDNSEEPPWKDIASTDQFDFAYCITVHKGQGSEWESVLVIDESDAFRENATKHRYTAFTRASEKLVVQLI
jgi:exodeoxyribonuclease-5